MALKRRENGTFEVKNETQAVQAYLAVDQLKDEIEKIKEESGLSEMMEDAAEMKKAADAYVISKGIDTIELPNGRYTKLIQAAKKRMWVLGKADIPSNAPPGTKSLTALLKKHYPKSYKEILASVTKRVVIPEAIDDLVAEGKLDGDKIAPAYIEELKAPYVRVFDKPEDDES